jgi:hypothetical protein
MSAEILTASISVTGALLAAATGYYFTKKRERDAEWRKEKLENYKTFVSSLSRVIESGFSPEGRMQFAIACNDLLLFAPRPVISALKAYQEETADSHVDQFSRQKHDELLSKLFYEMRADIGVKPKDDHATFAIRLWTSKVNPHLK